MKFLEENSDKAILRELGERISRYRLNRNMTQSALADEAGISERTMIRLENGEPSQILNFVRVLRVLDLLENLEALVPEPPLSPIQQVKMHGKQRQRASSSPTMGETKEPWSWGDDE
jgi:transcriptional regulator with XRE-family HTH domain